MLNEPKRPPLQAILVMDSRKTSVAVRHQNFSGAWSQLYKAGDVYLDLQLRPAGGGATLQGYLVADPRQTTELRGHTSLHGPQAQLSAPIGAGGSFRLEVPQAGDYCLEVTLQDQVIRLESLAI